MACLGGASEVDIFHSNQIEEHGGVPHALDRRCDALILSAECID